MVSVMVERITSKQIIDPISTTISIEQAYKILSHFVTLYVNDDVKGLKAGLTTQQSQRSFGIDHPIVGYLYSYGKHASGTTIASDPQSYLECELGFVIDEQGRPVSAVPVIEVPRWPFNELNGVAAAQLLATNIAADRFIVGQPQEVRSDYESLSVSLTRDAELILNAKLTDALGGPSQSLDWMLREAAYRKLRIEKGMLCITGACGGLHVAQPGDYVADYGVLGRVTFTIV